MWVCLTTAKDTLLETAKLFLKRHGHANGEMICCDQEDELAYLEEFQTRMMKDHDFIVEPTGAYDLTQNDGVESWNNMFSDLVRALIHGATSAYTDEHDPPQGLVRHSTRRVTLTSVWIKGVHQAQWETPRKI